MSSNFRDRLIDAMNKRKISAAELSRISGVSAPQISQYTNGIYKAKQTALYKLSIALGVSEAWLMGYDVPMDRSDASKLPSNIHPVSKKHLPMLENIECGKPVYSMEDYEYCMDANSEIIADFCIRAKGDSMIGARINDGDIVFIQKQDIVNNGEIAAVIIGNEATLKKWYYYPDTHKLVLNPENPAFEPLVYVGEELNSVKCIGLAVFFIGKLTR